MAQFFQDHVLRIIILKIEIMFSKETLDKVKLAKKYIENRYQTILSQQQKSQQNWNKILTIIDQNFDELKHINESLVKKQTEYKRLKRQKDCLKNYRLYNIIGKGAFGEVRLARNIITNEMVAIKRLDKNYLVEKKQIYNAYLERDFLAKSTSQFIVQMKSTFQDENYLYIAMEYVQGGDLLHLLIERDILTQDQTRFYIAQLVLAVQQIHKMNYVHRDIKPDNILIDKNGHIKISDFGLSKHLQLQPQKQNIKRDRPQKTKKLTHIKNKQKIFSKVGTPDYISPQVLTDKMYTHLIDIWGIGIIMFECLYGYPPFTDENSKEVCHRVANWVDYLEFPEDIQVSSHAKSLLLGLINHKNKRLSIKQIKKHPFFNGINWELIGMQKAPNIPKVRNETDTSNFDDYQVTKPWNQEEKQLFLDFLQLRSHSEKRVNHSQIDDFQNSCQEDKKNQTEQISQPKVIGSKFRFPGFDFRRIDNDPLQKFTREFLRKSCPDKNLKKKIILNKKTSSIKNLKFQKITTKNNRNETQKKNLRPSIGGKIQKTKKSAQKTRPSQMLCTNNNISINLGRFHTSKQLLKTQGDQPSKQKPASKNIIFLQNSSPAHKKPLKTKAQKMKQIYCSYSYTQKLKTKKFQQLEANNRTHA